jgi:hypothetical protein
MIHAIGNKFHGVTVDLALILPRKSPVMGIMGCAVAI